MVGAGSPVEMRLDDNTYALNASVVSDDWQPIVEAYLARYQPDYPDFVAGFPPIDEAEGKIAVIDLHRT